MDGIAPIGGSAVTGLPAAGAAGGREATDGFARVLAEALERVDAAQREAERLALELAAGRTDDVAQVMLAGERARLVLQLAAAVRDRVVEGVKELLRMPI